MPFFNRSAKGSYLKQLDPTHHEGPRRLTQKFSIDWLYVEAHKAPLQLKCEKLAFQFYTQLKPCPSNPVYDCILNPKYKQHCERKEKSIKPFDLRMKSTLQESKISLNNIQESI